MAESLMAKSVRVSGATERRELRIAARARRRAAAAAASDAAARAARHFLAALAPAPETIVALYWPRADEMDPRPLMEELAARAVRLALPVVTGRGQPLVFRAFAPGDRLEPGPYGIPAPPPMAEAIVPTLLAVPLLAFDGHGNRLGEGGGYYDRTLAALRGAALAAGLAPPPAVGYAYAEQEWPALPEAPWDQRLDWIVSEREARKIP